MPSPVDATPQKRKKACQRCRHRKQKCDFEQPCHNCEAAGVECTPVTREPSQHYPAGYVHALENHVAMLEQSLNGITGSTSDHLSTRQPSGFTPGQLGSGQSQPYNLNAGTPPEAERGLFWQSSHMGSTFDDSIFGIGGLSGSHPSPPDLAALPAQTPLGSSRQANPLKQTIVSKQEGMDEIPTATAASFFRTYFQFIHPQYPFMDVKTCGEWYTEWKMASADNPINGWPAFFVKMIFSIGSLIQSKSDNAPRFQHQDLKSQAQNEDFIIRSSKSSPLIRLQAMLLSAMHALHSESTARIAHISGAIVRFAILHGFHRLIDLGDEESRKKTLAWSCAYVLDRAVSATLDLPVALSDVYISSALYIYQPEASYSVPWLNDAPHSDLPHTIPTSATFAHICKIRLLQSYIMHTMQAVPLEGGATPEWVESMRLQIENWAGEIASHSIANTESYQSPLWLGLISQLSRLLLCRPSRMNINTNVSDVALQASCDACTTFRALQKKRQIAQPWLVVITQFQAGITILYIVWARAISIPKEADLAIRDCTSVLAILADRWQNAEHYRDCFEVLARAIPRSSRPGYLSREVREELADLTEKVVEAGVHRHVTTMLWEMASLDVESDVMDI